MEKTAIVIPCYNEEKRLNQTKFKDLLERTNVDFFFVNDGSTDLTLNILEKFKENDLDRVFIIDNKKNMGKASAIFTSVTYINKLNQYLYIGYYDADFSTPISEVVRILKFIEESQPELVFGSRVKLLNTKIKRKFIRHIIGRTVITIINLKFHLGIYDTQCGTKFFKKNIIDCAFNEPFLSSWLFDVEIFTRLKKSDKLSNAVEFPLIEWQDVDGSKLSWKSGFKIIFEIYTLFKKL